MVWNTFFSDAFKVLISLRIFSIKNIIQTIQNILIFETDKSDSKFSWANARWKCVKSVQTRSFFWPVFSSIRTEYGKLRSKSLYSVRIQENKGEKKLRIWTHFTHCDCMKVPITLGFWLYKSKHFLIGTFWKALKNSLVNEEFVLNDSGFQMFYSMF